MAFEGRPDGREKLAPCAAFIQELIAQNPDITLFELRDALANTQLEMVHHSGIAVILKHLEHTHNKVFGCGQTQSSTRKAEARELV